MSAGGRHPSWPQSPAFSSWPPSSTGRRPDGDLLFLRLRKRLLSSRQPPWSLVASGGSLLGPPFHGRSVGLRPVLRLVSCYLGGVHLADVLDPVFRKTPPQPSDRDRP